jgi:hypothetical protein
MRWGSGAPEGFMDTAVSTEKNWYSINRDQIPKELRDEGYDTFNIVRYLEILYSKASATSIGGNVAGIEASPDNLLRFSKWQEILDAGENPAFSQPYEDPPEFSKKLNGGKGIPSSVWKSDPSDQDPSVTLWFKDGKQFVSGVLVTTMNQQDGNE